MNSGSALQCIGRASEMWSAHDNHVFSRDATLVIHRESFTSHLIDALCGCADNWFSRFIKSKSMWKRGERSEGAVSRLFRAWVQICELSRALRVGEDVKRLFSWCFQLINEIQRFTGHVTSQISGISTYFEWKTLWSALSAFISSAGCSASERFAVRAVDVLFARQILRSQGKTWGAACRVDGIDACGVNFSKMLNQWWHNPRESAFLSRLTRSRRRSETNSSCRFGFLFKNFFFRRLFFFRFRAIFTLMEFGSNCFMKKIQISDCGARIVPFTMTTAEIVAKRRRKSFTWRESITRVIKFNSICTFSSLARIIRETFHINQFHVRCRAHFHELSSLSLRPMIDSNLIHHQFIIFLRSRLVSFAHKNHNRLRTKAPSFFSSPRYHFLSTHNDYLGFFRIFTMCFSCPQLQSTRSCTKWFFSTVKTINTANRKRNLWKNRMKIFNSTPNASKAAEFSG